MNPRTLPLEALTLLGMLGLNEDVQAPNSIMSALIISIESQRILYDRRLPKDLRLDWQFQSQAVRDLLFCYDALSEYAFQNLMYFAERLRFNDGELGREIKTRGILSARDPSQVGKRGIYLQTFRNSRLFTEQELENEIEVKSKMPWCWIDAMQVVDPSKAQTEIISQLSKETDLDHQYARLRDYATTLAPGFMDGVMSGIKGKVHPLEYQRLFERIVEWREIG